MVERMKVRVGLAIRSVKDSTAQMKEYRRTYFPSSQSINHTPSGESVALELVVVAVATVLVSAITGALLGICVGDTEVGLLVGTLEGLFVVLSSSSSSSSGGT